jgi:hypothetical protein
MRELHVIVKEEDLRSIAPKDLEARQALAEIQKIKQQKPYFPVNQSYKINPRMPPPAPDMMVWVSGISKYWACAIQLYYLRQAGYNALFHPKACLDFLSIKVVYPEYLPHFRELVPEFPDYSTH